MFLLNLNLNFSLMTIPFWTHINQIEWNVIFGFVYDDPILPFVSRSFSKSIPRSFTVTFEPSTLSVQVSSSNM